MNRKTVVIAIAILIACCTGIYFWAEWQKREFDPSLPKPPAVTQPAALQTELFEVDFEEVLPFQPELLTEEELDELRAGLPPSHVPDEFPEHLKLPQLWENLSFREEGWEEKSGASKSEIRAFMRAVMAYVVEYHNPKRPIAEVWPLFMEAEARYNNLADQEFGADFAATGGGHLRAAYEQIWAFPEVMKIKLHQEDTNALSTMVYNVEMGEMSPDWNIIHLPHGRIFRAHRHHQYEFRFPGGSIGGGFAPRDIAETIVVDNLFEISNEELKRLGGWNYNYNPYTDKPIVRYRDIRYGDEPDGDFHIQYTH